MSDLSVPRYHEILCGGAVMPGIESIVVSVGDLFLPSGRLYCCDPFLSHEVAPLDCQLRPGSHPVKLLVADIPGWGRRVALAGLVLSSEKPVEWLEGTYSMEGRELSQYRVDAGLACFMDAETERAFGETVDRFYDKKPDKNYYDDVLAAEFARNTELGNPRSVGDWSLHYPIERKPLNVAMFASGLGDGVYPCYLALDARGDIPMVVTDFGLI